MTRGCGVIRWRIKGTCKQSHRSPKTWSDAKHICCCFVVTTTLSVRSSNVNKQLSSYSPLNPRSWSIPSGRKGLHLPLSLAPSQFECSPSVDKRPLTGELMIMTYEAVIRGFFFWWCSFFPLTFDRTSLTSSQIVKCHHEWTRPVAGGGRTTEKCHTGEKQIWIDEIFHW